MNVSDWKLVELTAQATNRAHNARCTKDGYGPMQWLRGRNISLPTSLTDSADNLAAQHTIERGTEAFRQRLRILRDADVSWVKADNSSRVRRAILSRVRPTRGPFLEGSQIYIWRNRGDSTKGSKMTSRSEYMKIIKNNLF